MGDMADLYDYLHYNDEYYDQYDPDYSEHLVNLPHYCKHCKREIVWKKVSWEGVKLSKFYPFTPVTGKLHHCREYTKAKLKEKV